MPEPSILELRAVINVTDPVTGEPANGWVLDVDLRIPGLENKTEEDREALLEEYAAKLVTDIISVSFETRRNKSEPPHLRVLPSLQNEKRGDPAG